ncbi:MAG: PD40 domain-containing protein [Deltaproteobacteria bacterium]|nr:PD40 domain-containing protein [Deltaproteobacteria bacterium]
MSANKFQFGFIYLIFSVSLLTACGGSHTPQEDFAWSIPPSISTPVPTFTPIPTSSPQDPEIDESSSEDFVVIYESNRALDGSETKGPVRNIWSYSNKTKQHTPLTKLTSAHSQSPEPSPDGKKILFVSDRNLDGTDSTLKFSTNIWIMNQDGSGVKPLTKLKTNKHIYSLSWSPNGKKIAYLSNHSLVGTTGTVPAPAVVNEFMLNIFLTEEEDGYDKAKALTMNAQESYFTNEGPCGNSDFSFSPDSEEIVYVSTCHEQLDGTQITGNEALWKVKLKDPSGSSKKLLSSDKLPLGDWDPTPQRSPEFSPDGKTIIFRSKTEIKQQIIPMNLGSNMIVGDILFESDNWLCWEVDAKTGVVIDHLTSNYTSSLAYQFFDLAPLANFGAPANCYATHWTPDGERILVNSDYMTNNEEKKDYKGWLFLMEPYGGSLQTFIKEPQNLFTSDDWATSQWSADGSKLVYVVDNENVWITGMTKQEDYCEQKGNNTINCDMGKMNKLNFSLTLHSEESGIYSSNPRFLSNKIPNYFLPSFDIKKPNEKKTNKLILIK